VAAGPEGSVLKTKGMATLAKLVRSAGPEMISSPVYFILMETEDSSGSNSGPHRSSRSRAMSNASGGGALAAQARPVGGPRIKAMALDTLTYALLVFPRDEFDMEVVAKIVSFGIFEFQSCFRF